MAAAGDRWGEPNERPRRSRRRADVRVNRTGRVVWAERAEIYREPIDETHTHTHTVCVAVPGMGREADGGKKKKKRIVEVNY